MSPSELQALFSSVEPREIERLEQLFDEAQGTDPSGELDVGQLARLCKQAGESAGYEEVLAAFRDGRTGAAQVQSFNQNDFVRTVLKLRTAGGSPERGGARTGKITRLAGATLSSQHSIDEEELAQFVGHINQVLRNDAELQARTPIEPAQLFEACRDGLVLSKLINDSVPETIDERVLNRSANPNPFQMTENNNVVINSAKAIGCSIVNIGSQDLFEGRAHLVLGLVWQVIKRGLLARISLQHHPELTRLLEPGETLEELLRLPADELLLRWFNYHLQRAAWPRRVHNFSGDVKDATNYLVLLNQLQPAHCSLAALHEPLVETRAEAVLQGAQLIGSRKYISVKAIVDGNPKLNLAFVANLFNHHPGLDPLSEQERAALDDGLFASLGDREARAFALWMNSLGVEPFVNSIFDDLRNGLVLLHVMDRVRPGSVDWRRVVRQPLPLGRFQCIQNTNLVVEIAKQWGFSLVGIQGADVTDGSRTLTLALVWQLMREHIVGTLKLLAHGGHTPTETDMVEWANALVRVHGGQTTMASFKDPTLRSGRFFIELLASMRPDLLVLDGATPGETDEEAKMNAKYAISVARKIGATIFLLPDDIIEVKPKMILTFVGSLMAIHYRTKTAVGGLP